MNTSSRTAIVRFILVFSVVALITFFLHKNAPTVVSYGDLEEGTQNTAQGATSSELEEKVHNTTQGEVPKTVEEVIKEPPLALIGNYRPQGEILEAISGREVKMAWLYDPDLWIKVMKYTQPDVSCPVKCSIQFGVGIENWEKFDGVLNQDGLAKTKPPDTKTVFIHFDIEPGWESSSFLDEGVDIISHFHFFTEDMHKKLRAEGKKYMLHNWNYANYASASELLSTELPVNTQREVMMSAFISKGAVSGRTQYLQQMMNSGVTVHSFGSQLHNADENMHRDCPMDGPWWPRKKCIMRKYRFHFAAENKKMDSYVTEKFWLTLEAGVVPVVLGAPNIRHFCPNSFPCMINTDDFQSPAELAKHLIEVHNNDTLYDSYQEWRKHPLSRQWEEIRRGGHEPTTFCSLCTQVALIQASREGKLGSWNHTFPYDD